MTVNISLFPQIIDYYHAVEKIDVIAKYQYPDSDQRKLWLDKQKDLLLNDQVNQVIAHIKSIRSENQTVVQAKQIVVKYYEQNEERMLYKTYKDKGLLIGSGPIEAAHRNVIQQRLKLSGQKWTIKGAQAIANLRCSQKGYAWNIIDNLNRIAA